MVDAVTPPDQRLSVLYREHRSWLENWLRHRVGNSWDAADLSQDTFLRVLSSAQKLEELREPRAYLLTVGKRLLSNFYSRRSLEAAYLEALAQLPEECVP
ncbi:MAG: RNA polymerase subunit sigma, partial [Pantoea sp.]